jgi:hypothetical protein
MNVEINEDNFFLYAARNYYSPRCLDAEEFQQEISRFKYIKRLFNRYTRGGELCERLILNHITILLNVFGNEPAILMLVFKTGAKDLPILKPFLQYLNALKEGDLEGIESDPWVVQKLENI